MAITICFLLLTLNGFTPSLVDDTKLGLVDAFQPAVTRTFHAITLFSGRDDSPFFTNKSDNGLTKQTTNSEDGPSPDFEFGRSVPYVPLRERGKQSDSSENTYFSDRNDPFAGSQILQRNRRRNIGVAIISFAVSILHYGWLLTHPVTAVELLATMQAQSAPLTSIGNNGKPTVIDFWAPWCENCKVAAPTLKSIEDEYSARVNFIMVNGDDRRNYPLIELFGVDAIPHLALLSNTGDVETALIGPMSRNVLRADIEALLAEGSDYCGDGAVRNTAAPETDKACHEELPYKMYDAFWNRPESRRIMFVEQ